MSKELDRVREFVEVVHQFFTDWVSGKLPKTEAAFQAQLDRLDPNFMVRMPGGGGFEYPVFKELMYDMHGGNPKFVIKIRNVAIRHKVGEALLVTYEEWERDAKDSTPPNNARFSTMMLREKGDSYMVLHVHETWFPADKMAAGDYNF